MAKPTLEGFYYYFGRRANSRQRDVLLKALARLAKYHPDKDPRLVLTEYLNDWIYRYEKHIEYVNLERVRGNYWEDMEGQGSDTSRFLQDHDKDKFALD